MFFVFGPIWFVLLVLAIQVVFYGGPSVWKALGTVVLFVTGVFTLLVIIGLIGSSIQSAVKERDEIRAAAESAAYEARPEVKAQRAAEAALAEEQQQNAIRESKRCQRERDEAQSRLIRKAQQEIDQNNRLSTSGTVFFKKGIMYATISGGPNGCDVSINNGNRTRVYQSLYDTARAYMSNGWDQESQWERRMRDRYDLK
jgi:hypothetical protein